ncbi:CD209 antigen-like protein C [Paramisgurnus dabryanus]|uniref:CD209 antigen-like protein C n=1 Tax=Paramisgurnus dabryanus TaxID=90735 RepID=UPI003CCF4A14
MLQKLSRDRGSERVKMTCCRSVTVCLVLLCDLLLTAVIVLRVLINTNNQHRDQLVNKNHNLTEEINLLLIKNINLTKENDGLLTNINNSIKQRDQIMVELVVLTDGWIYKKISFYFISSELKSWNESRSYCRERGADLIIINNREEQDFVQKESGKDSIWIGLSDIDEESRWKWVDGSTLTTSFWSPGEPNGGRGENCVESVSSGWNDLPCDRALIWICEKKIK